MEGGVEKIPEAMNLNPAIVPLSTIAAKEVAAQASSPGSVIISLGDSLESFVQIIKETKHNHHYTIVSSGSEELAYADIRLTNDFGGMEKINFRKQDVIEFLRKFQGHQHCIITSNWLVHDYEPHIRKQIFQGIANCLRPGQSFVYVDKIYPDDSETATLLQKEQEKIYKEYLESSTASEVLMHEATDFRIRMRESETLEILRSVGFSYVNVVQRISTSVVIIATK